MTYQAIQSACHRQGLDIAGGFHPQAQDNAPTGCKTLLLLAPHEPGFWQRITASPEFDAPDPVDRWSDRVIGALAGDLGATAVFPFGGPPYQPFVSWALRTGRVWASPVNLMVHDRMGLLLSFRGALAFERDIVLPPAPAASPCAGCVDKPCMTACPAGALRAATYDLDACHGYLGNAGRETCLSAGCLARRSCPVSRSYGRLAEQSAHHMRAFHKG